MSLNYEIIKKVNGNQGLPLFRFKKFNEKEYLLTNEIGEFVFLSDDAFQDYIEGTLSKNHGKYQELFDKCFFLTDDYIEVMSARYKEKNSYLQVAPGLHIMVLTLKCNHKCLYCHAAVGMEENHLLDMSKEIAKNTIDLIFSSPSIYISIEFQGGEPMANWAVLMYSINYICEKKKESDKDVRMALVSNFSLMTDEKLEFLLDNDVFLCTSLDGPEKVHNGNRLWSKDNSFKMTAKWVKRVFERIEERELGGIMSRNSKPRALVTITKDILDKPRELIDTYLELGFDQVFLRPITPLGFATQSWDKIGYKGDEFMDFYKEVFEYILELNLKGVFFRENWATIKLKKIFNKTDPAFTDDRSPCGGGVGQIAYNYDGKVYTCDEGRMIGRDGDDMFCMGDVGNEWEDLISSIACKSICSSSCTDGLAGLSDHVYKPYIGVCPAYNYASKGQVLLNFYNSEYIERHEKLLDYLFEHITSDKMDIFNSWIK